VTVLAILGFGASLSLLNVDAFIVEQNTMRLAATGDIDIEYLTSLSNDAVPNLVKLAEMGPEDVREELLPQLACTRHELETRRKNVGWPSFHISHNRAYQLLEGMKALDAYTIYAEDWYMVADGPTGETYCNTWGW
jgi:hypothetical protein